MVVNDGAVGANGGNCVERQGDKVGLLAAQLFQFVCHSNLCQCLGAAWVLQRFLQPAEVGAERDGIVRMAQAVGK